MRKGALDLSSVTEKDWVRLAAFIDGEGSILLNRFSGKYRRKNMYVRVTVVNTDIRLPHWIASVFGGPVTSSDVRHSSKHRPCWRWQVSCTQAAQVLEGCMPYFLVKREQAELALKFQSTVGGPGRPVTQELADQREEIRRQLHMLKADNGRYDESKYIVPILQKTGPKPKLKTAESQPYLIQ
jgi:hypothetical protein